MAVLSHAKKVEIFKFASTGMTECLLEAADFIREEAKRGRTYEVTGYRQDLDDNHYFVLKEVE